MNHVEGIYYACKYCQNFLVCLDHNNSHRPLQCLPPNIATNRSTSGLFSNQMWDKTSSELDIDEDDIVSLPPINEFFPDPTICSPTHMMEHCSPSSGYEDNSNILRKSSLPLKESSSQNSKKRTIDSLEEISLDIKLIKSKSPVLDAAIYSFLTQKYARPKWRMDDGIFLITDWQQFLEQIVSLVDKEKPAQNNASRIKSLRAHFTIPNKNILKTKAFEVALKNKSQKVFRHALTRVRQQYDERTK